MKQKPEEKKPGPEGKKPKEYEREVNNFIEEKKIKDIVTLLDQARTELAQDKSRNLLQIVVTSSVEEDTHNKYTPLDIAVRENKIGMVELLLEKGVVVNRRNRNNDNPLHIAVCEKNINIVKLLLEKGADVNAKNNNQQTPLQIATSHKATTVINLLKAANINK